LHSEVYTPQLVINGQTEMIGSNAAKITAAINKILSEAPRATVSIQSAKVDNDKININFTLAGDINNSEIHIALIEDKVTTPVKAGENNGVTLDNYNVVKNFKTITKIEDGENSCSIDVPSSSGFGNNSVIVFLQRKPNGEICAADKTEL
jgi:hypothetical protein